MTEDPERAARLNLLENLDNLERIMAMMPEGPAPGDPLTPKEWAEIKEQINVLRVCAAKVAAQKGEKP